MDHRVLGRNTLRPNRPVMVLASLETIQAAGMSVTSRDFIEQCRTLGTISRQGL